MKEYRKVSGLEAIAALQQGKVLRQFYNKDLVKEIFPSQFIDQFGLYQTFGCKQRILTSTNVLNCVCHETWEVQCDI